MSPVEVYKTPGRKSLRSVVTILKFLIILSLNLYSKCEVKWENDSYAWVWVLSFTHGPVPHCLPDGLNLIGKDSDAGRDWGQDEKGTTEDEMAGWHHRLDGCEFE